MSEKNTPVSCVNIMFQHIELDEFRGLIFYAYGEQQWTGIWTPRDSITDGFKRQSIQDSAICDNESLEGNRLAVTRDSLPVHRMFL